MSVSPQPTARLPKLRQPGRWVAAVVLLIVVLFLSQRENRKPPTDTAARIAFYQARLGGRGSYPAYAELGDAYLRKARETGQDSYLGDAERYLRQSLAYQPNYEALRGLAAVLLAQHNFREALAHAQQAARAMPSDLGARGLLFDAHMALGEYDMAAEVAGTMAAVDQSFVTLARVAALRAEQGDLPGAVEAAKKACGGAEFARLPAETRAWCQVRLGGFHVVQCEAEQAEAAYRRAIEILPGYFLAREHLAELRAAQGKTAEAVEMYRRLLQSHPGPQYRLALADLYEMAGQSSAATRERESALAELRRSVERGSRGDWRPLALLLLENKNKAAEGLAWAEKDWENRQDVFAADTMAWALSGNGRHREAEAFMEKAAAHGAAHPGVLVHAAAIQLRMGRRERAHGLLVSATACPLALVPGERALAERMRGEVRNKKK